MTVDELVNAIYEDNYDHLDFMENMNGGDCDCFIHSVLNLILRYSESDEECFTRTGDISLNG